MICINITTALLEFHVMYKYNHSIVCICVIIICCCDIHLVAMIVVETLRLGPAGNKLVKMAKSARILITDGKEVALQGLCLLFMRVNRDTAITNLNTQQVH